MRRSHLTTTFAITCLVIPTACGDDGSGDGGSSGSGTATSAATDDPTATTGVTGTMNPADTTGTPDPTDTAADGSSDETGPQLCPDIGEPCTVCESTQCPDEYCSCYNNGSCLLLAQCAAECDIGDAECNQACWTQYPEGISDGAVLTHCAATTCTAECGPYVPLTDCQLCLYSQCPESMNVCISNPECTALLECLDACEMPGCENTCYALYPDGLADSGPVGECAQDACLVECA